MLGGAETRAGWAGVDAAYKTAMNWDLKERRFITNEDVENAAKICVLGDEVATALFGNKSPLGEEIKIARRRFTERFTVVGTLMPRGRSLRFGWHFDNLAFIPVSTVQERFTGNDQVPNITVWAHTVKDVPKAIEEVKAVMRKKHRNQDDFFSISELTILMTLWVAIVLVIPNFSPFLAACLRPIPTVHEVQRNIWELERGINQQGREEIENFIQERGGDHEALSDVEMRVINQIHAEVERKAKREAF